MASKLTKLAGARTATPTQARAALTSPIVTPSTAPDTTTALGGGGWMRTPRGELYLATVGGFVTTGKHHEDATRRMARVGKLARAIALEDDGVDWLTAMVRYARSTANIRDTGLVIAVEATAARVEAHVDAGTRHLVDAACDRADEPGKLLKLWISRYGVERAEGPRTGVNTRIPNAIKKGLADAVARLYDEYSLLRYDTEKADLRFGWIISLTHPTARDDHQDQLFKWAIERAKNWKDGEQRTPGPLLTMLHHRQAMESVPVEARRSLVTERIGVPFSERLTLCGASWEWVSGWLADGKGMTADVWEALIQTMGYMAALRNLRNFDQAGVSDAVAATLAARLADPIRVAKSKQLPFRFLSAYRNAPSLRWGWAIEQALTASLLNVPILPGRTLICIDRSPSMFPGHAYSTPTDSDITCADQAALFGGALALRANNPTVVVYGGNNRVVEVPSGGSLLKFVDGLGKWIEYTDTARAVREHYRDHDRVVIITDEQSATGDPSGAVPAGVPVYVWNLAGYQAGNMASGSNNRHTFGGLSDDAFRMISLLESGRSAVFPWEAASVER